MLHNLYFDKATYNRIHGNIAKQSTDLFIIIKKTKKKKKKENNNLMGMLHFKPEGITFQLSKKFFTLFRIYILFSFFPS